MATPWGVKRDSADAMGVESGQRPVGRAVGGDTRVVLSRFGRRGHALPGRRHPPAAPGCPTPGGMASPVSRFEGHGDAMGGQAGQRGRHGGQDGTAAGGVAGLPGLPREIVEVRPSGARFLRATASARGARLSHARGHGVAGVPPRGAWRRRAAVRVPPVGCRGGSVSRFEGHGDAMGGQAGQRERHGGQDGTAAGRVVGLPGLPREIAGVCPSRARLPRATASARGARLSHARGHGAASVPLRGAWRTPRSSSTQRRRRRGGGSKPR
jgi:hypothetical protein